jgi:phosphomevalonate kinase
LGDVGSRDFSARLKSLVDDDGETKIWDTDIRESAVNLPSGLRLVMCDVDCGSETPGMVKKVFTWRKENSHEAALLWGMLQKRNEDLAQELHKRSVDPDSAISYRDISETILSIRSLIREMSGKAGVPIEPWVQTKLLDACSRINGVVGGVVPGAGGFDALALLVEDRQGVIEQLTTFLDAYTPETEEGESASIGKARLLDVNQEIEGIKLEAKELYEGWL